MKRLLAQAVLRIDYGLLVYHINDFSRLVNGFSMLLLSSVGCQSHPDVSGTVLHRGIGLVCTGQRVHWSAWDIKRASQTVLLQHPARFRHVFVNILDRLFEGDRIRLEAIHDRHLREFKDLQEQFAKGQISESELREQKALLGERMVSQMSSILEQIEFAQEAYCVRCDAQCPISPRDDPTLSDYIWIEAAGNTCCPWSSMCSTTSMWLDAATLPFLVCRAAGNLSYLFSKGHSRM
jgi:hypothetical protein